MLGSTTAPGRLGARAGAPCRVAFHSTHSVGVPRVLFSRLNTQPMRTPVNASPKPSRASAHDSGTVWFARPSLAETCTLYSLPVSRRTHCQLKQGWYPPAVGDAAVRCREALGTPIGCPLSRERSQEDRLDRVKLTMPPCCRSGFTFSSHALGRRSLQEAVKRSIGGQFFEPIRSPDTIGATSCMKHSIDWRSWSRSRLPWKLI